MKAQIHVGPVTTIFQTWSHEYGFQVKFEGYCTPKGDDHF